MAKTLTLDKVRAELRPLGLSIRKRDEEYRVAFTASVSPQDRAGIEASAYYTDNLSDAWATGLEMARGQKRNPTRSRMGGKTSFVLWHGRDGFPVAGAMVASFRSEKDARADVLDRYRRGTSGWYRLSKGGRTVATYDRDSFAHLLTSNPTTRSGLFSATQLAALHREFAKISTVHPNRLADFHRMFDRLGDPALLQISNAKIKFLSPLAVNEARRRGLERNPKRRGSRMSASEAREVFGAAARGTDQAYKGYRIHLNHIRNEWYVSKGGAHIGTFPRVSDAKAAIDLIADPGRNPAPAGRKGRWFNISYDYTAQNGQTRRIHDRVWGYSPSEAKRTFLSQVLESPKHTNISVAEAPGVNPKLRHKRKPVAGTFAIFVRKSKHEPWAIDTIAKTKARAVQIAKGLAGVGLYVSVTDGPPPAK